MLRCVGSKVALRGAAPVGKGRRGGDRGGRAVRRGVAVVPVARQQEDAPSSSLSAASFGEERLLLMRHAKSSWKEKNLPDHARPLNKRGRRAAQLGAQVLAHKELAPDVIYSSDAERCRETWRLMSSFLEAQQVVWQPQLYLATSPAQVAQALGGQLQGRTPLLLGHNPNWEQLLEHLTTTWYRMPTGAVAVLRRRRPGTLVVEDKQDEEEDEEEGHQHHNNNSSSSSSSSSTSSSTERQSHKGKRRGKVEEEEEEEETAAAQLAHPPEWFARGSWQLEELLLPRVLTVQYEELQQQLQ